MTTLEIRLIALVVAILAGGGWFLWHDHVEINKGRTEELAAFKKSSDRVIADTKKETIELKTKADMATKGSQDAEQKLHDFIAAHPDRPDSVCNDQSSRSDQQLSGKAGIVNSTPTASSIVTSDRAVQGGPGVSSIRRAGDAIIVSVAEQLAIDEAEFQKR